MFIQMTNTAPKAIETEATANTVLRVKELEAMSDLGLVEANLRDMIADFEHCERENARAGYVAAARQYAIDADYCWDALEELGE